MPAVGPSQMRQAWRIVSTRHEYLKPSRSSFTPACAGTILSNAAGVRGDEGTAMEQRRRRIDRVTATDFLNGLDDRTTDELRTMRDDCREEEAVLSFARRVVQGQTDIARAEQARRSGGHEANLVDELSGILAEKADGERDPLKARTSPLFVPGDQAYASRLHDPHIDDPELSRIPDLDDEELAALRERLSGQEVQVSELRRSVLDHLDALQAELVRRYRDGAGDVDAVVASAVRRHDGTEDHQ